MKPCETCSKMVETTVAGILNADTLQPHVCRPENPTERQKLLAAIDELGIAVTDFLEAADAFVLDGSAPGFMQSEVNHHIYQFARLRMELADLRRIIK